MKKTYIIPIVRLHDVHASDVIITSDNVPIGDDVNETSTDAPRRASDWSDYNG